MTTPNLVDVLFDVRTGYHVVTKPAGWFDSHPLGEGNPLLFAIIRMEDANLPEFWRDVEGSRVPLLKLDTAAHAASQKPSARITETPLSNVWKPSAARFVQGSQEEFESLTRFFDTRQNAILTVGTGKTYATISAAIAAASSGDIIEVYSTTNNTYTEAVTVSGKSLQIIGMVANRGLTITYSSGNQVCLLGYATATDWVHFKNFKVVPTGSVWRAAYLCRGIYENCEFVGGTQGAVYGASSTVLVNCLARDGSGYGFANLFDAVNCVAVDCPTYGFQSGGAGYARAVLCIAAACGTAGFNSGTSFWQGMLNCSSDASAPGGGSASGFLTSDFVDYSGNDFRLKASVKETTKARFDGYPPCVLDAWGEKRRTGGIVFAGFHDPDPETAAVPAAPSWSADPTPADAQVTLHVAAAQAGDVVYARYRSGGAWSAENETLKRTGSGDIVIAGLVNGNRYDFAVYAKAGALTSDWSEPKSALPVGAGQGTSWSPVLSRTSAYWEGVF